MSAVIIAGHVFRRGENEIVGARRKLAVAVDGLVDRVVLEADVEDAVRVRDIRRGERNELSGRETAAVLRTRDTGHQVRGAATEARPGKGKAGSGGRPRRD